MGPENEFPKPCYVILHLGIGPSSLQRGGEPEVVAEIGERFVLSDDIWIERLDVELAINVQKACEPPHHNIGGEVRDRHLYAFVRKVPDSEMRPYEGLESLHAVMALSRLIQPTSVGSRYCTKVHHYGLPDSAISAVQYGGISPDVFVSRGQRDWLSVRDAERLRALMPWLSKNKPMHDRVRRAYWYHEYAMRSYLLDMRFPLVTTGLEALINTEDRDSGRQFYKRVVQLAQECEVCLEECEAQAAWKLRSKLSHAEAFLSGLNFVLPQNEHTDLYEKLEAILRSTVRRCLMDESFGNRFRDREAVEAHWPLGD